MVMSGSIAAATAIVGYDLLKDDRRQQVQETRILEFLKLAGSGAAGDSKTDLYIGDSFIGGFFNTATGFGNNDDEQQLPGVIVYPGEKIHLFVTDAPVTNPLNYKITERPIK